MKLKERKKVKLISRAQLFATPWTVACEAPQSMEFSRQGYWSGLPFPSPGHLPNPRIKPGSLTLQADSLLPVPPGKPNWINNQKSSTRIEELHRSILPKFNIHLWSSHSYHTQWWKAEIISSKIRNKTRIPVLTTSIQNIFGSPSHSNQRNLNREERSKLQVTWYYT